MPTVIRMTRQGQSEFVSTQPSPAHLSAQPDTSYQLLDAQGKPVTEYVASIQDNGDLWIDLPDTNTRPDFILEQYADYYPAPSNQQRAYFGSLEAAPSNHVAAETAAITAETTTASTTTSASGLSVGSLTWSAAAATAGILGAVWLVKRHDDDDNLIQDKPSDNSGTKPSDNSGTKPSDNSGTKPSDNSGTKPSDNSGTKPSDNSGNQPSDNSGTKPSDNSGTKPSDNSGNQPSDNSGTKPSDNPGNQPSDNSGNQPSDNSGNQPSDNSGNQPSDNSGNQPSDNSGNQPSDNSGNQPSDNSGNQPSDNSGNQPSNTPAAVSNRIVLPQAYTKELLNNGSDAEITAAAQGGKALNQYQSNPADKQIVINDLNNLSKAVRIELSQLVADLINPIREKWGVGKFVVTEGALKFAQDVADEYAANNQSIWSGKGHYDEGITRAAAKHGLNTGGNYYENMAGGRNPDAFTLDDLKHQVYDRVVQMLFDDAHAKHDHAQSLLNASQNPGQYPEQNLLTDYLGVDTSSVEAGKFSIHFISAADSPAYIQDASKFDKTPVAATPTIAPAMMMAVAADEVQPVYAPRSAEENDTDIQSDGYNPWADRSDIATTPIPYSNGVFTRDHDAGGIGQDVPPTPRPDVSDWFGYYDSSHLSASGLLDMGNVIYHTVDLSSRNSLPAPLADAPQYSSETTLLARPDDAPQFDLL